MKKKRKVKKMRLTAVVIIVILGLSLCLKAILFHDVLCHFNLINSAEQFISKILYNSKYPVIKQDTNANYPGKGQETITDKDGYFTTFTTIENDQKTYIDYKQNGNSSWSDREYWDGTMAEYGCGITALATILSGYGQNDTPEELRKKYYPLFDYDILGEELSHTFHIDNTGFYYDSDHLSKEQLQKHLKTNRPILICLWNKPSDNRWTTASHYMVLLAADDYDMVYVANPNGGKNDSKSSGWYEWNEVIPYIAKALYIESYH